MASSSNGSINGGIYGRSNTWFFVSWWFFVNYILLMCLYDVRANGKLIFQNHLFWCPKRLSIYRCVGHCNTIMAINLKAFLSFNTKVIMFQFWVSEIGLHKLSSRFLHDFNLGHFSFVVEKFNNLDYSLIIFPSSW